MLLPSEDDEEVKLRNEDSIFLATINLNKMRSGSRLRNRTKRKVQIRDRSLSVRFHRASNAAKLIYCAIFIQKFQAS